MPVIIIVLLLCQCTSSKKNIAAKDTSEVIFFDDFSKHTLDRSKWNVVVTGFTVNNEQQAYVDSSATIYFVKGKEAEGATNGALVLQPRYTPNFTT